MKRSAFASLAALTFAAAASVGSACIDFAKRSYGAVRAFAVSLFEPLARMDRIDAGQVAHRPTVERIAAKAFLARLVKRDRPRIEAGWRMCPSA